MYLILRKSLILLVLLALSLTVVSHEAYASAVKAAGIRFNKPVKSMKEIKQQNIVKQSLDFSCGAAGLSTLLNFYLNDPISEEEIINSLLTLVPLEKVRARRGFSLLDLKTFAESEGYKVTGYKMDIDYLRGLNKPVLVPIKFKNYRHFVIIRGVVADRIFIADPAAGNMSMKISKFENVWTNGIGLVVEDINGKSTEYALKVDDNDLLIADYKRIRSLVNNTAIRTAVYPLEFK